MATGTTYTVHVQEFALDRDILKQGNYSLQVAKTVKSDKGVEAANVVYKSHDLAANMDISWEEDYAVNWTVNRSEPGVKVRYGGNWEPAKLGHSFNINDVGTFFKDTTAQGDQNSVNISKNGYASGIYIVLGLKGANAVDGYTPIYVSPNELLQQGTGYYTPIEKVEIWYQSKDLSATGISHQRSYVESYTMVNERERYFYLPLAYGPKENRGKWLDNAKRFSKPADTTTPIRPLIDSADDSIDTDNLDSETNDASAVNPVIRVSHRIRFSHDVEKSLRIALGSYTAAKITQILRNVSNVKVEFKKEDDGKNATADWEKPQGFVPFEDAALAAEEEEDDKAAIDQALKDARKDGKMDKDETWSIDP